MPIESHTEIYIFWAVKQDKKAAKNAESGT
jgi:hypothetical protein